MREKIVKSLSFLLVFLVCTGLVSCAGNKSAAGKTAAVFASIETPAAGTEVQPTVPAASPMQTSSTAISTAVSSATSAASSAASSTTDSTSASSGRDHILVATPGPEPPAEQELVPYTGPVRHIFFHPLILYPEKAFIGDSLSKGLNDWFVTTSEFRGILDSIYKNQFILIRMEDVCGIEGHDGVKTVVRRKLYLPKGKKPLIISIDDMNYYDYMRQYGCASRLVLDSKGFTAVESARSGGLVTASCEDVVPMVDEFVRQHPDFSYKGAKGIIALTGYQGILGYRTNNRNSPTWQSDRGAAVSLVNDLKSEGWSFACHGYGHLNAPKVSFDRLKKDVGKWGQEVEPLIGKTGIYIYPYGSALKFEDEKFKLLKEAGFNIFCGVGPDGGIEYKRDFAYLDRKSIDGLSMSLHSKYLSGLFDISRVVYSGRPKGY